MNLLGLVVPGWARAIAVAVVVAAAAGWGYVQGRAHELDRAMAEQLAAGSAREQALHQALAAGRVVVRDYHAYRARAEATQSRLAEEIRRAPTRTLYRVECPEPAEAAPGAEPAGDVRLTARFVRLWDGADGGDDVPTDPGGAARAAGELSAFGPRDLLANHRTNAAACELDRERYRRLIRFIREHQEGRS